MSTILKRRRKKKITQMHTHKNLTFCLQDVEKEQSIYGDYKISRQKSRQRTLSGNS